MCIRDSIEAAKENGVKVIGFSENQNDLAPGTVAASIKFDFGKIYSWILDHYMDGKLNGNEVYGVGIEEEIFIPIFTDEVSKEVQQTLSLIHIFLIYSKRSEWRKK